MTELHWHETSRREWDTPAPPAPNGSTRGGTDYFLEVCEQTTWPADGSVFAGWTYERRLTWQGPDAAYRDHVLVGHSQYPAPGVVQPDGRAR